MKETNKTTYILLLAIIFGSISCNPVKKVLADIDKVKAVRTATDPLFPCANDTTVIKETKTDTLTNTEYKEAETTTDTLRSHDTVFITKTKTVTYTVTHYVTQDHYIVDNRQVKSEREQKEAAQQSNIKALEQANSYRSQRNWSYAYISIMSLIILILGYLLFKKKSLPKVNLN